MHESLQSIDVREESISLVSLSGILSCASTEVKLAHESYLYEAGTSLRRSTEKLVPASKDMTGFRDKDASYLRVYRPILGSTVLLVLY